MSAQNEKASSEQKPASRWERRRTECYNEADLYKKAETFVGYLQQREVNGDYHKFYTFVQILQETGQTEIASRLRG